MRRRRCASSPRAAAGDAGDRGRARPAGVAYRRAALASRRGIVATAVVVAGLVLAGCEYRTLSDTRWQCGVHRYYVNPQGAPAGGVDVVHEGFRRLNAASGGNVQWRYGGTTTATGAQSGRVIVAWRDLEPGVYGRGVPQPWPTADRWTGGVLLIDPSWPTNLGIVLHELGHVAGLAHVESAEEVMYANATVVLRRTEYGAGDLAGLRDLAAGCTP